MIQAQKILIAPMDWGLGHATRMMPVIDALLAAGHEVWIAGAGESLQLLSLQYPQLTRLELPAYRVTYPVGSAVLFHLIRQVPRLLGVIWREHRQLEIWIKQFDIERVISDNRYGLWSRRIPCYFVCHQLAPLPSPDWSWLHYLIYRLHRFWIRNFEEVWVPDFEATPNLAGKLVHRFQTPPHTRFLGPLSRFAHLNFEGQAFSHPELNKELPELAIVLSGPEPQRSFLAEKLKAQASQLAPKTWLVLGKTHKQNITRTGNLTLINFLETADLHRLLLAAKTVVSRPGYSSIMDYAALGLKQVILIPTPGQTEQEYLARNLERQQVALRRTQKQIDLTEALGAVQNCQGFLGHPDFSLTFEQRFADMLTSWQNP